MDGDARAPVVSLHGLRTRALFLLFGGLGLLEFSYRSLVAGALGGPGGQLLGRLLLPAVRWYAPYRAWVIQHPVYAGSIALAALVLGLLAIRHWLLLWHNELLPRINGTYFRAPEMTFPFTNVDLLEEIRVRPPGMTFVGLTPVKGPLGTKWDPVYLDLRQREVHQHVLGKTGSGKTASVIWPQALQDILDGKAVIVMSGKGSDEEIDTIKGIAQMAGREKDLRVFALPAWNRPEIPTHAYNMVYVEPRTPTSSGGDPVATAERVFKALPMGDNVFYNQQAQIMFRNIIRALHGMVDGTGFGVPFVMRDVATCLKGVGNSDAALKAALEHVLWYSVDREAVAEIRSQVARLGHEIHKVLSGLVGAVDQFLAPMVNAYDPDIIIERVLEEAQILYVQLPSNLYKIQAPSLGKVFLMDVQQEGSLRQVYRTKRRQDPVSIIIDEFARFADTSIVDSLSQLRDAHLHYLIAHQSLADLQSVSHEFSVSVWDNSRVKIVLNQDNPALCEMVAKSIGTHQETSLTVRRDPGPLWTSLQSGVASSRQVESYKLHPNRIKSLRHVGQAYLYTDAVLKPLVLAQLPAHITATYRLPVRDQTNAEGARLSELVARRVAAAEAAAGAPPPVAPATTANPPEERADV